MLLVDVANLNVPPSRSSSFIVYGSGDMMERANKCVQIVALGAEGHSHRYLGSCFNVEQTHTSIGKVMHRYRKTNEYRQTSADKNISCKPNYTATLSSGVLHNRKKLAETVGSSARNTSKY